MSRATRSRQQGLGLIMAIFLVTVGALMALVMATFLELSQGQVVQEFQAARAMAAAESGLQRELNRLLHANSDAASCAASQPTLTNYVVAGIAGCSSSLSCTLQNIDGTDYFTLVAEGRCGGADNSLATASRRLQARVWK